MAVDAVTGRVREMKAVDFNHRFWLVVLCGLFSVVPPVLYISRPLHVDESIFLVVGHELQRGATLYVDVIDHKPPGIFILSAGIASLPGESYQLARIATYVANGCTAGAIVLLGRQVRNLSTGLVGGLLFLIGVYLPHFDGFYFLTEPYAILLLTLAALLLLTDRALGDGGAGLLLGMAVLLNQTVFLFGISILALYALEYRYHRTDRPAFLRAVAERFVRVGVGFAIPVLVVVAYLAAQGVLAAMFRYTIYLPLTTYHTPFGLTGHVLALVSYLPVWLLAGGAVVVGVYRYYVGERVATAYLLLVTWFLVLVVPGAIGFNGDHKLLFAFPPAALLAAITLDDLSRVTDSDYTRVREVVSGSSIRAAIGTAAVVGVVVLGLSIGTNGLYALALMGDSVDDQIAAAERVNETVDDTMYTLPFHQELAYFSDDLEPANTYLGAVYGEPLAREVVHTLESDNVTYVVVADHLVTDDYGIRGETGFFPESRGIVADYVEREYEYLSETERFVIFRRK